MCAGKIIILEAGGYVCDMYNGKEHDINGKQIMVASHKELALEIVDLINN
jgi:fructose-1,6-bisphosphatase/inositol monophosphatase family enzyme